MKRMLDKSDGIPSGTSSPTPHTDGVGDISDAPLIMASTVVSDVGYVRSSNQDSGFAGSYLIAMADGMGGHAGGDTACTIVIRTLSHFERQRSHESQDINNAATTLKKSILAAHDAIVGQAKRHPELTGMGTTIDAVVLVDNHWILAHIGDSRAYLLRNGVLIELTKDHSYVQHLLDTGRITEQEAKNHPQRSIVIRVLGDFDINPYPDLSIHKAYAGDRWLLCSDGLSGPLSDEIIHDVMVNERNREACTQKLVNMALKAGSTDNVTAVIADAIPLPQSVSQSSSDTTTGNILLNRRNRKRDRENIKNSLQIPLIAGAAEEALESFADIVRRPVAIAPSLIDEDSPALKAALLNDKDRASLPFSSDNPLSKNHDNEQSSDTHRENATNTASDTENDDSYEITNTLPETEEEFPAIKIHKDSDSRGSTSQGDNRDTSTQKSDATSKSNTRAPKSRIFSSSSTSATPASSEGESGSDVAAGTARSVAGAVVGAVAGASKAANASKVDGASKVAGVAAGAAAVASAVAGAAAGTAADIAAGAEGERSTSRVSSASRSHAASRANSRPLSADTSSSTGNSSSADNKNSSKDISSERGNTSKNSGVNSAVDETPSYKASPSSNGRSDNISARSAGISARSSDISARSSDARSDSARSAGISARSDSARSGSAISKATSNASTSTDTSTPSTATRTSSTSRNTTTNTVSSQNRKPSFSSDNEALFNEDIFADVQPISEEFLKTIRQEDQNKKDLPVNELEESLMGALQKTAENLDRKLNQESATTDEPSSADSHTPSESSKAQEINKNKTQTTTSRTSLENEDQSHSATTPSSQSSSHSADTTNGTNSALDAALTDEAELLSPTTFAIPSSEKAESVTAVPDTTEIPIVKSRNGAIITDPDHPQVQKAISREAEAKKRANHRASVRLRWIWGLIVGSFLILIIAAGVTIWQWSQSHYYVGEKDGYVTIYKGVPTNIFGWHLSHEVEKTQVPVDELPPTLKQQIKQGTITAPSVYDVKLQTAKVLQQVLDQQRAEALNNSSSGSSSSSNPATPSSPASSPTTPPSTAPPAHSSDTSSQKPPAALSSFSSLFSSTSSLSSLPSSSSSLVTPHYVDTFSKYTSR